MEPLPLKDIHLPAPSGFWPPAPGWWLALALLLVLIVAFRYIRHYRQQRRALSSAAKLLRDIQLSDADALHTLIALSTWLRRVALSTASRNDVAALRGKDWLAYLDKSFSDAPFSQGIGQCLADAPYRPVAPEQINLGELFKLCERWLKLQKPQQQRFTFSLNLGKRGAA